MQIMATLLNVLIATLTAVDCNFHLEIIMFDLQVGI